MNSTSKQQFVREGWLQFGLWFLAIVPLLIGVWAFFAPYHFYEIFPLPDRK